MDCRGSALILHAPLPTSTLCLFSTEAQKKEKESACIAVGAGFAEEGLMSLFANWVKH